MGKAEDNKKKKEEALYDTAFALFTTKGINDTTISDIVEGAKVAKGTFYLYFKDKYELRDKLITRKTSELFVEAIRRLRNNDIVDFTTQVLWVIDYVIEALKINKDLLRMISKDLSWGVYRKALDEWAPSEEDRHFSYYHLFMERAKDEDVRLENPEITLFLIIEMVGSVAYVAILYGEPCGIDVVKEQLYESIRSIILAGMKK